MEFLQKLRLKIDIIDEELVKLLAERQTLVKKIGKIKKKQDLKIIDGSREQKKLTHLEKLSQKHNLDGNLVRHLWLTIFEYARRLQQ